MPTRRTRTLLVALAAVAPTGCGPDAGAFLLTSRQDAGDAAALVGTWRTTAEPLQPQGSWQRTFVVHPDLRVEHRGAMYGLYPADKSTTISASSTLYGRLEATATKFVVHPDSLVTIDRFYQPTYYHVQRNFPNWYADSSSYTVQGDVLTLTYYSYPLDAPVLTQSLYYRAR